jgi:hypothetical protein
MCRGRKVHAPSRSSLGAAARSALVKSSGNQARGAAAAALREQGPPQAGHEFLVLNGRPDTACLCPEFHRPPVRSQLLASEGNAYTCR